MSSIQKITFFKNHYSQYDVLHDFRRNLIKALEKLHVRTDLIDLASDDRASFFKSIYVDAPDYTCAFNGLHPLAGNKFLCDELEIPHIAWLVDSAHYFYTLSKIDLNISIFPDEESVDIMKGWGAKHAFFLPHAFEAELATSPSKERSLPIVFCGSLMDPIEIEQLWDSNFPPILSKDLKEAAVNVLETPALTYQQAYKEVQHAHLDFFSSLSEGQMADIATTLDRHVRATDRINLLNSLKGLPIHIYGNCLSKRKWGDFIDLEKGTYTISPAINFHEAHEVMKNAQIVLNSSPMFKTGGHERIFYGLGLGATVLTNETPWNQTHFTKEELLVYPSGSPNQVYDQVEALLSNTSLRVEMANLGQKKVLAEHTWDVRAKQLLVILTAIFE